ncbi:MAG: chemotaxis protein CheX [Campylobacterota bacterium]|nr:chemotaxis protein CheX [Campylobacterota bacterium]
MNSKSEILTKLANRTISYFKEELQLSIDESFEITEVDSIEYLDISTLISLSNGMSGTIGMSVSSELAYSMVEGFIFGEMDKDELEELSSENVAETLNITLGNILKDLDVVKNGASIDISTPYTMHNSVTITKKKNGKMILCKMKSNDKVIILSYFI